MLNKIIDIISTYITARFRPRRRLTKLLVELHANLRECDRLYRQYKAKDSPEAKEKWRRAAQNLYKLVKQAEPVLEIHAEDVFKPIKIYSSAEIADPDASDSDLRTTDLKEIIDKGQIDDLHINVDETLRRLRAFIRSNFSMEEIHEAGLPI